MSLLHWFLVSAVVVAAISAWCDLRTGHIPNWVTLGPLFIAPIAHAGTQIFAATLSAAAEIALTSVVGALVCAIVPLVLYRAGAIGGGDVKLLAALGAICRPLVGIEIQFYSFLAAALIACAHLAYEGKLMRVLGNTLTIALNPFLPKERRRKLTPEMMTSVRFGPAIFLGALAATILNWRASW